MILYFTGTGNSKYVAQALQKRLNDEIVSLNDVLKYNQEKTFHSEKPFVVVAPIYAWNLPERIYDLISEAKFRGSKKIYFVATMGGKPGNTGKYAAALCRQIKMEFMGFMGVKMVSNFVSGYYMPDQENIERIIRNAMPEIELIAARIEKQDHIENHVHTSLGSLRSGLINKMFNQYYLSDKGFRVSDACISCGLCEKLCPLNNIELINGTPVWQGNCMACYACIHHCPKTAIEIKGKSEGRGRYVCPEYPATKKQA